MSRRLDASRLESYTIIWLDYFKPETGEILLLTSNIDMTIRSDLDSKCPPRCASLSGKLATDLHDVS